MLTELSSEPVTTISPPGWLHRKAANIQWLAFLCPAKCKLISCCRLDNRSAATLAMRREMRLQSP